MGGKIRGNERSLGRNEGGKSGGNIRGKERGFGRNEGKQGEMELICRAGYLKI